MENPRFLRKKVFAIFKAAFVGAVFADALIVIANVAYDIWGRGHQGPLKEFVRSFGLLLAIPSALVSGENRLVSPYIVNGLLGALLFAAIAFFWQFLMKGDNEKSY